MTSAAAAPARVLVFDSGLGGLTVLAEISRARPEAEIVYAADDACFPYGALSEAALVDRVGEVVAMLIERFAPDLVVVACNTASTLVLAPLRAAHPRVAFVGTVPAIKPAASASRSGLVSVLATPGTVARDYTRALVRDFASSCEVTLVGSARLAEVAERRLRGEAVGADEIACEIAPCFVSRGDRRTDQIVLACTHFPLLTDRFARARALAGRVRRSRAGDRAPGRCAAGSPARRPAGKPAVSGAVHQRSGADGRAAKGLASLRARGYLDAWNSPRRSYAEGLGVGRSRPR